MKFLLEFMIHLVYSVKVFGWNIWLISFGKTYRSCIGFKLEIKNQYKKSTAIKKTLIDWRLGLEQGHVCFWHSNPSKCRRNWKKSLEQPLLWGSRQVFHLNYKFYLASAFDLICLGVSSYIHMNELLLVYFPLLARAKIVWRRNHCYHYTIQESEPGTADSPGD